MIKVDRSVEFVEPVASAPRLAENSQLLWSIAHEIHN
jgi:hypothetical protein